MKTARAESVASVEKNSIEELRRLRPQHAHMIDAIVTGVPRSLSQTELKELTHKQYLSFPELATLTQEESELLTKSLPDAISYLLNERLAALAGDVYYDGKTIFGFTPPHTKWTDFSGSRCLEPADKEEVLANNVRARKLTVAEKLFVAFGISTGRTQTIERFLAKKDAAARVSWGNRPFFAPDSSEKDCYMYETSAREFIQGVRNRMPTKRLQVLDMGGGIGKAMVQIKELDKNIETTNLTLEEEPVQLAVDNVVHFSGDRLPATFFEKFDVIVSNVSFRYYAFAYKALQNAFLALSIGGEARLNVACDSLPATRELRAYYTKHYPESRNATGAASQFLGTELARLQRLEKQGFLQLTFKPAFDTAGSGSGYYKIVKLKSISPQDYLNA